MTTQSEIRELEREARDILARGIKAFPALGKIGVSIPDSVVRAVVAASQRPLTAQLDEAISLSVYFRQATEAAESRLEELTRERDELRAKGRVAIDAGEQIIGTLTAERDAALARLEEAKAVLEPFDEMHETASKLSDLHGENEFILSFGPAVVVGVLPFDAIHKVHAFLHQGGSE